MAQTFQRKQQLDKARRRYCSVPSICLRFESRQYNLFCKHRPPIVTFWLLMAVVTTHQLTRGLTTGSYGTLAQRSTYSLPLLGKKTQVSHTQKLFNLLEERQEQLCGVCQEDYKSVLWDLSYNAITKRLRVLSCKDLESFYY